MLIRWTIGLLKHRHWNTSASAFSHTRVTAAVPGSSSITCRSVSGEPTARGSTLAYDRRGRAVLLANLLAGSGSNF